MMEELYSSENIDKIIQDNNSAIKFCNIVISSIIHNDTVAAKRFANVAIDYLLESVQRLCSFTGNIKMRDAIEKVKKLK